MSPNEDPDRPDPAAGETGGAQRAGDAADAGVPADVAPRVEQIVQQGGDVRAEIGAVVAQAAASSEHGAAGTGAAGTGVGVDPPGRLVRIARRVVEAAVRALDESLPEERSRTLRRVVDGASDGIATAAYAAQLALREARDRGETFAREDLKRWSDELSRVRASFAETVERAAGGTSASAKTQARELREHAQRALTAAQPHLEAALKAAREDPLGLAKDTVETGVQLTRRTAGGLLGALGNFLAKAGEVVRGDRDRTGS